MLLCQSCRRLLPRLLEPALDVVAIAEAADEEHLLGVVKSHLQGRVKHLPPTYLDLIELEGALPHVVVRVNGVVDGHTLALHHQEL